MFFSIFDFIIIILEFLTWKEKMEHETRTYFIRSRRVSAENRYNEYYNCNRTGKNSETNFNNTDGNCY